MFGIIRHNEIMTTLVEFVTQSPPDLQKEVRDSAEFLLEKRSKRMHKVPSFDWEGALEDLGDQYTSVELQHEILKTRGE